MRKVRVIEDVVNSDFTVEYKDNWWTGWKQFTVRYYDSTHDGNITYKSRDTVYAQVMKIVKSLEKEKVIYETPKPVYYP